MVTNWEETIKMPINEPAPGKRKSQIQVRLQGCLMLMHVLISLLIVRLFFLLLLVLNCMFCLIILPTCIRLHDTGRSLQYWCSNQHYLSLDKMIKNPS